MEDVSSGYALEAAVYAAAKQYARDDRAELHKQHTPRAFGGKFISKAPVDYRGWAGPDRLPVYVECKATSDTRLDFSDRGGGIEQSQLEAMRDAVQRSIRMLLVVDMQHFNEILVVDVKHVVEFAKAPWRNSLSIAWLRAYGDVALERDRGTKHWRVWWLDTMPHVGKSAELHVVEAEKRQANRIVELYPPEIQPSKKLHERLLTRPAPGTEEHKEYVRRLADEGLKRQMGARPKSFGRKQAKKGWY